MRYAVVFVVLGSGLVALAVRHAGWTWALLWPAASALLVGAGYGVVGARVFGKRRDGSFAWWAWSVHFVYLLITLGVWYVLRWAVKENAADEVAPGVWVGRRPLCHELPEEVAWVVDLTAEFWPARGACAGRRYVCYPTLDGHVADDRTFVECVREVAGFEGPLLIHCAQGHGRSAALAAAVMIERGLVEGVEAAEEAMRRARPKIGLEKAQRELVRRISGALRPAGSAA